MDIFKASEALDLSIWRYAQESKGFQCALKAIETAIKDGQFHCAIKAREISYRDMEVLHELGYKTRNYGDNEYLHEPLIQITWAASF